MMANLFRASLMLVALLLSPMLCAQTLWTKAGYGMTIDQVKAAFPDAVSPSAPDRLYGGEVELLTMPGIEVAHSNFRAQFFFKSDKLVQVTLALENPGSFDTLIGSFKAIREILRAKYGPELDEQVSGGTMSTADVSWLSGPTNINLIASGVGNNKASLKIIYQVRLSKEAEKL